MIINYRGLTIPRVTMGRVTSDNLFDPNEQVIFDFYEAGAWRYKRAVDVGANIGVHSILMARAGWEVMAFEPDPVHFAHLRGNLRAHGADGRVAAHRAAVSDRDGDADFVRVLDNTTSSHIAGDKVAHGPVEVISVPTVDFRALFAWGDFFKIDCEGHEAALIECAPWGDFIASGGKEAMLEVGSEAAAHRIFRRLIYIMPMWAQKIGWRRVWGIEAMPTHHSQGSLFIGQRPPFPEVS